MMSTFVIVGLTLMFVGVLYYGLKEIISIKV